MGIENKKDDNEPSPAQSDSVAYRTFQDWYSEIEGFSLRCERLEGPVDELKAAFAAGQSGMRLTDSEREAIRRLRPSDDPLASVTVTLTPAERTVFHGLLERLGDKEAAHMSDTDERSGASAGSV